MDKYELTAELKRIVDNHSEFTTWTVSTPHLLMLVNKAVDTQREKVAQWMIDRGYATGHGDTIEDLLKELEWQVGERERDACAKIADTWKENVSWEGKTAADNIAHQIRTRGNK